MILAKTTDIKQEIFGDYLSAHVENQNTKLTMVITDDIDIKQDNYGLLNTVEPNFYDTLCSTIGLKEETQFSSRVSGGDNIHKEIIISDIKEQHLNDNDRDLLDILNFK